MKTNNQQLELTAGIVEADNVGRIALPAQPSGDEDWALKLTLV